MSRKYFYHIDVHGRLYLKETAQRNITSCFKDIKFLDFFYSRLCLNSRTHAYNDQGYHYVSPCGKEMNYVYSEDSPIVFQDIVEHQGRCMLVYAGSKRIPFYPEHLQYSSYNGRIYHPLPDSIFLPPPWVIQENHDIDKIDKTMNVGLLSSNLIASHLMRNLKIKEEQDKFILNWNHKEYELTRL